jgi:transcriptional regulator with XRE-family HTH domain
MTTAAKPWDLGFGTNSGGRPAYVPGIPGLTYSEPLDPVEEFGSGRNRVVIRNPRKELRYVTSSPGQGRTGEGLLQTVVFEDLLYAAGDYPYVLPATVPFAVIYPTQADVLDAIEGLRARLNLQVETTARLLGVEKRTYQGWKSGEQPMPIPRLQTAMNALVALGRLAADDPAAARKVFEEQAVEATKLVATGQFAALRALVDRASAAIAREMAAVNPAIDAPLALPEGVDAQRSLELVDSAEFRAVTAYMERLAPEIHATTVVWKTRSLLGLQAAVERLSSGDQLGDDWLFLVALTGSSLEGLDERAQALLRHVNTTEESWKTFLNEETERAWRSYSVPVAEPAEEGSSDPSANARPADLYDFSHFGFDLATGQVRENG